MKMVILMVRSMRMMTIICRQEALEEEERRMAFERFEILSIITYLIISSPIQSGRLPIIS